MDKRLVLAEDDIDDIDLILPEDDIPLIIDEPIEEPVASEEVVVNAYSGLLQDLLRKQWDVINSADGIIATLDAEAADVNKEDVKAILQKLVDDTTVSIGMVTKALGVVDPSQEELMDQGIAKAEEVIETIPEEPVVTEPEEIEEPIEESTTQLLTEDVDAFKSVNFENETYYDRFLLEEALYQLECLWDSADDIFDERSGESAQLYIDAIDNLSSDDIEAICREAVENVRDSSSIWDRFNEYMSDEVRDAFIRHAESIKDVEMSDINIENREGE